MPERHTTRLNPRDPLVIDIRELGRRPGSMRRVERTVPAPSDLGLELAGVPEGAPLELDLRLEAVVEGVLISGTVTGPLSGECGRCLVPVSDEVVVDLQELFAYPDSATDETTEEGEVGRIEGDLIDLEPYVRDAVVLGLPLSPLCADDCRGLCATCGMRWDELPADHTHDQIDPRWAALTERFGQHQTDSQES
ncbi:MAG TPA: YceD family protein [Mycobacteriales bacterium]|nr:YceD family protein [Mycobacteriales bacterium]